jgi:hypothetical protein
VFYNHENRSRDETSRACKFRFVLLYDEGKLIYPITGMPEMIIEGIANPLKNGTGREDTFLYNTVVTR